MGDDKDTLADSFIRSLKNNRLLAIVIVIGLSVIGVAKVVTSFNDIIGFFGSRLARAGSSSKQSPSDGSEHNGSLTLPSTNPEQRNAETRPQETNPAGTTIDKALPNLPGGNAIKSSKLDTKPTQTVVRADECKYILFPSFDQEIVYQSKADELKGTYSKAKISLAQITFEKYFLPMFGRSDDKNDLLFSSPFVLLLKFYDEGVYKVDVELFNVESPVFPKPELEWRFDATLTKATHYVFDATYPVTVRTPMTAKLTPLSDDGLKRELSARHYRFGNCSLAQPGVTWVQAELSVLGNVVGRHPE